MTRVIRIVLAAMILPLIQFGYVAHASGGNNNPQTVALHRQACTGTGGAVVGTARFSLDDHGGSGGMEMRTALTSGEARTSYSVFVLANPCQVLVDVGTLKTDDSGRGDLDVHVPGSSLPPGASLRVQLVAPADVITSDPTSTS